MTRRRVAGAALAVVLVSVLAPQPGASAAPVIPSPDQISAARAAAGDKAQQVGAIKAELADAQTDLVQSQVAEDQAGQAYDAALLQLADARRTLSAAQTAERAAQRDVAAAQRAVGVLVRTQVQSDAGLLEWASLLDGGSPQDVIEKASEFGTVSASLDGLQVRLAAAQRVAAARQQTAAAAATAVQRATDRAADAKTAANRAVAVAAATVSGYAARRDELIVELARAEQTTVALVRQREAGLAELARERAEARRKAAEAAQRRREATERAAEARAAVRARAQAAAARAAAARTERAAAAERGTRWAARSDDSSSSGSAVSVPAGSSGWSGSGYSSSAAQTAIAFARRQLGKPYVFGATGPGTYDCSGLTMRAWQAAGIDLPRLAASQYEAIQPISAGQLRPGDLVFWGSTPDSIYHVAMYIGGGELIEAPRPGRTVDVESLYGWITPSFYGRV